MMASEREQALDLKACDAPCVRNVPKFTLSFDAKHTFSHGHTITSSKSADQGASRWREWLPRLQTTKGDSSKSLEWLQLESTIRRPDRRARCWRQGARRLHTLLRHLPAAIVGQQGPQSASYCRMESIRQETQRHIHDFESELGLRCAGWMSQRS